jgi:hypothetical protein
MADSERASPFTIPAPAFEFAVGAPSEPSPSRSMTVGGLVHNLTVFAHFYEQASAAIDGAEGYLKPFFLRARDAKADVMQRDFRATVAIDRVRAYVLSGYGADLTIGTARRLLGDLIRTFRLTVEEAEGLPLEVAMDKLTDPPAAGSESVPPGPSCESAQAVIQAGATNAAATGNQASVALMRVFTNGIADERFKEATRLLENETLTANEKLTRIDGLIPFPATASAEQLGGMLGVTKQAVMKTEWWQRNRKGEKADEIGRRREGHRKRADRCEAPVRDDGDE